MTPAFKWIRAVTFFGLVVMTTAMAASPVREALWPLASRQLARLSPTAPQPLTAAGASVVAPAALPSRDAATTRLAEADQPGGRAAVASGDEARRPFRVVTAPSSSSISVSPDELAQALAPRPAVAKFDVGPWQSRSGTSPARSGSASLRRGNRRGVGRAPGRVDEGGAADSKGSGGSANDAAGASGTGDAPSNSGAPSTGSGPSAPSAPSAPGAASGAPAASTIFTEHHAEVLPGSLAGSGPAGGGITGLTVANVSSTPEPSTLLLFGTGLAAVARGLRKRLAAAR